MADVHRMLSTMPNIIRWNSPVWGLTLQIVNVGLPELLPMALSS